LSNPQPNEKGKKSCKKKKKFSKGGGVLALKKEATKRILRRILVSRTEGNCINKDVKESENEPKPLIPRGRANTRPTRLGKSSVRATTNESEKGTPIPEIRRGPKD